MQDVSSPKSQMQSVPEMVYGYLKDGILSGTMRAGEALRQEHIATVLGVSRSPVREALNQLEREDLVVLRPRRGYVVASLEAKEIEEIFQLRALLEEHGIRLATQRRGAVDVTAINGVIDEMAELLSKRPDDMGQYLVLDRKFHELLIRPSGQRRLWQMISNLRDAVEQYVRLDMSTHTLPDVQREHRAIARAYKAGDEEKMVQLIRKHCEYTCNRVVALLRSS